MAPVKSKARAVVSDWETDNPVDESVPNMERRHTNTEGLNYSVVHRYVHDLNSILSIASFCVVYNFDAETQAWEKTGIDGSLFVNSLTPAADGVARFNILVLNRRSTDPSSFTLDIKTADDVELTDEYIILQHQADDGSLKIYGLWIFTEPPPSSTAMAREINGQMIKQCAMMADTSRKIALQDAQSSGEEEPQSVPMGRQLSLRELFGKQREADADFSIHHHEPMPQVPAASGLPGIPNIAQLNMLAQPQAQLTQEPQQAPTNTSTPRFVNTPDTDFFLSAPKVAQAQKPQGQQSPGPQAQAQRKPKHHPPRRQHQKQAGPPPAQYNNLDYDNMTHQQFYDLLQRTGSEGWNALLTPFGNVTLTNDNNRYMQFMAASDKFLHYQAQRRADKAAKEQPKVTFESTWTPTVGGVKVKSKAVTTIL
ncbi:hypothetical protein SLS57_008831 [Botryosphaeria dothidea]